MIHVIRTFFDVLLSLLLFLCSALLFPTFHFFLSESLFWWRTTFGLVLRTFPSFNRVNSELDLRIQKNLMQISNTFNIYIRFFRLKIYVRFRSSRLQMFFEIGILKNFTMFTGKHLCWSLFLKKVAGPCNFIKKQTPKKVFSREYCEIFKNSFFFYDTSGGCFSIFTPDLNLGLKKDTLRFLSDDAFHQKSYVNKWILLCISTIICNTFTFWRTTSPRLFQRQTLLLVISISITGR